MSIRSRTNLYPGINPHLNNFLRYKTGWRGFHLHHIVDISHEFDDILPYDYYPNLIDSLQPYIYSNEIGVDFGKDIHPMCPAIFSAKENEFPGELIVRIELIAPITKENSDIASQYLEHRQHAIQSVRCFVELDYLHFETDNTKPYRITTTIQNEMSTIYFGVIDPIPIIQIPLNEPDTIELDLGKLYNHVLCQSIFFYNVVIDYEQEPVQMDSFTPADQQAIRDMMAKIQREHSASN